MEISAEYVKQLAVELGADLVGIAAADSFEKAPQGSHPCDVLPECVSVIVLACESPRSSLYSDPDTYTSIRNQMADKMDELAVALAKRLEAMGADGYPIKSMTTNLIGDRLRGPISLKHAAVFAGLGKIGKNTLLINDKTGNMLWLSAVLTSIQLANDPIADYEVCSPDCILCVDVCPVKALGEEFMKQLTCFKHAFNIVDGRTHIQCWECRKICPNLFSYKDSSTVKS